MLEACRLRRRCGPSRSAAERAGDVRQLGIGLSVYVEVTALQGGTELADVTVLDDGTVRVLTGTSPHGQGHDTSWAMLVSERLGVPIEDIEVIHGDTDVVPAAASPVARARCSSAARTSGGPPAP